MNLNSESDFTVNRMLFEGSTGDRVINTNASRSLWFKQSYTDNGNAKIENQVSGTTHTFNVDVYIENVFPLLTYMEFNPVYGYLVFNNTVDNRSGNTPQIWGNQKVFFNGNFTSTTGTPGLMINGNAWVVFAGVPKTYQGQTEINDGATLQISSNQTLGDIFLHSGGTLQVDAGVTLTITGGWTGGGTIINNGTIVMAGTAPQSFPGSGSTVSAMNNFTINNVSGVTLDKAMSVSGTFTLSAGILTTTSANLLTVSNTSASAITGGSTASFISGPVLWNLPASLGAGSTYDFPVGKSNTYLPMSILDPVTGTGTITLTAEAFLENSGGTPGSTLRYALSTLSTTEYWSLASTGNLTNHRVSLTRQTDVDPFNRIGRSTTLAGTYSSVGGVPSGNSILNSNNTGAGAQQYFLMATAGPINVASSNGCDGDYNTLKAAFDAINSQNQTGYNVVVTIYGDPTESATARLNAGNWNTLTIRPELGPRLVRGSLDGLPLVNLNGADRVTIDGRIGGTGSTVSLTFRNLSTSATSGTSTIKMEKDATNNLITYCNVEGSSTMAVGTNGGNIYFGASSPITGNDNNTVSYCNIGPAGSNLPTKGVYLNGTTVEGRENSGILITNNNIYDYFGPAVTSSGIYVGNGNTDCNFTNNKFYQSATRTQTTGARHAGIWVANGSGNNFNISNNTIGYANSSGSGTYSISGISGTQFAGIYLTVDTTNVTSVQGNTIAGIAISGSCSGTITNAPFIGINVTAGLVNIGDISGNTIGSLSSNGSVSYTTTSGVSSHLVGIFGQTASNWTTNNNYIGGITASNTSTGSCQIYGLRGNTGTSSWTCNNNIVGGPVANSIQNTSTASPSLINGIFNPTHTGTFSNNIIRNLTDAGGTGVIGINITVTGANHTVSQNNIYNLANTSPTANTAVTGIVFNGSSGTNLVDKNFIYSLTNSSTHTSSSITGIHIFSGTTIFQNNIISLSPSTSGSLVFGFRDGGGTNNIYFNTISLTGTASTGSQDAALFASSSNTRNYRDNIFSNARTGSGTHHAVNISSGTGLTIDFNDYVGAVTVPTGGGANSVTGSPDFTDPSGTAATDYIPGNPFFGTDVGIATDYGSNPRTCAFTMGAWEANMLNTITLTSAVGTDNQTVCINTAIANITYGTTGATGATVTGLPTGVTANFLANVVTISGTPTVSGTFHYTVTLTGGCGTVTASGTITVDPAPETSAIYHN